jgi:CDP-diacylglycerol---glycerol-3-phosphate 3-phosphatidyltransferase
MATLYAVKPRFQALLRPLADGAAALGVTANAVTLVALGLSLVYGATLAASDGDAAVLLGLPALLLLRMALNAIDGMLAREHGQASRLGGRLNEIGDMASDLALCLPFALFLAPAWPVVLAVILALLAEAAGVIAAAHGGERRYDGPLGKADRALLYALVALAQALIGLPPALVIAIFAAAAAASLMTIVNRLAGGLRDG